MSIHTHCIARLNYPFHSDSVNFLKRRRYICFIYFTELELRLYSLSESRNSRAVARNCTAARLRVCELSMEATSEELTERIGDSRKVPGMVCALRRNVDSSARRRSDWKREKASAGRRMSRINGERDGWDISAKGDPAEAGRVSFLSRHSNRKDEAVCCARARARIFRRGPVDGLTSRSREMISPYCRTCSPRYERDRGGASDREIDSVVTDRRESTGLPLSLSPPSIYLAFAPLLPLFLLFHTFPIRVFASAALSRFRPHPRGFCMKRDGAPQRAFTVK